MNDEKREKELNRAFEEVSGGVTEVAGLKLRTFSFRAFQRSVDMNLRLIVGSFDEARKMPAAELLKEVATIAWMQSEPVDEVFTAFRAGDDAVREAVEYFEETGMQMDQMRPLMVEVLRVTILAREAYAETVLTDSAEEAGRGEDPPPNC
ncbi:MAG: hypothetical protein QM496_01925 [Verrucomicrobiota bacterium]